MRFVSLVLISLLASFALAQLEDERLTKGLTFAVPISTVQGIAAEVMKQTGVDLRIDPGVREDKVTLYCESVSARDVLRQLAKVFRCQWVSGDRFIRLERLPEAERERTAWVSAHASGRDDALRATLSSWKSLSGLSDTSVKDRYVEIETEISTLRQRGDAESLARSNLLQRELERLSSFLNGPDVWRVVAPLAQLKIDALERGEVLLWSGSELGPVQNTLFNLLGTESVPPDAMVVVLWDRQSRALRAVAGSRQNQFGIDEVIPEPPLSTDPVPPLLASLNLQSELESGLKVALPNLGAAIFKSTKKPVLLWSSRRLATSEPGSLGQQLRRFSVVARYRFTEADEWIMGAPLENWAVAHNEPVERFCAPLDKPNASVDEIAAFAAAVQDLKLACKASTLMMQSQGIDIDSSIPFLTAYERLRTGFSAEVKDGRPIFFNRMTVPMRTACLKAIGANSVTVIHSVLVRAGNEPLAAVLNRSQLPRYQVDRDGVATTVEDPGDDPTPRAVWVTSFELIVGTNIGNAGFARLSLVSPRK